MTQQTQAGSDISEQTQGPPVNVMNTPVNEQPQTALTEANSPEVNECMYRNKNCTGFIAIYITHQIHPLAVACMIVGTETDTPVNAQLHTKVSDCVDNAGIYVFI